MSLKKVCSGIGMFKGLCVFVYLKILSLGNAVDSIRKIPVPLETGSFSEYEMFVTKVFNK